MTTDVVAEFRRAIEQASIPAPDPVIADGRIHRFCTNGRKGSLDGWYVLYNDGLPAGRFGCWRSGVDQTWSSRADTALTDHERTQLRQRLEYIKRQREEEEKRRRFEAAMEAERIWNASKGAPEDHPYLVRKQVKPYDLRIHQKRLLVPLRDATGALHSLQFIDDAGDKRFLPGGRVSSCHYQLGNIDDVILIAEGFATAGILREATGFPVVIAFNAGNLVPVAEAMRYKHPGARIVLCGDNDKSGVGQEKAREAATLVNGVVAIPDDEGLDWNDVAEKNDLNFVQKAVSTILAAGSSALDDVHSFLGRFVAYPSKHAHVAHTLWIAHAHLMEKWESTPRLAALSPEPGSGKTRLLEITETLVPRPVEAVNATPAYLFRKVSDPNGLPTILFDEIDTIFGPRAKEHEEIRGLLNAGHRRGAMAGRCVVKGKSIETEEFPAFCAVALAGLGNLPDTILTRAIVIRMRRRAPTEKIEPYRRRIHAPEGNRLRDRLQAWAQEINKILNPYPEMPDGITDRPADVWEALLSVADAAGSSWSVRAREAAVAMVADAIGDKGSLGIRLLTDLRNVFGANPMMPTADILASLNTLEEAPWGDLKGKPLDSRRLSQFLRPYGVSPKNIRFHNDIVKGYSAQDLFDPWQRYLCPSHKEEATTATEATPKQELQLEAFDEEVNLDA